MGEVATPHSLAHTLGTLAVGQSVAEAKRLDLDFATREELQREKRRLNNMATTAVARAKAKHEGRRWSAEIGHFPTASHDLMLCCVITRTA